MHFLNSLYRIKQKEIEKNSGRAIISLNKEHPIYRGHFPGNPVTPGVCSLEILTEFIAVNYPGLPQPAKIEQIKFLNFINPVSDKIIRLEVNFKANEDGSWRVRGMLGTDKKQAVKLIARYAPQASLPHG